MTFTAQQVRTVVDVAKKLATGNYGYTQGARLSAYAKNGKLGVDGLAKVGDTDCSMSAGIAYVLAGMIPESVIYGTFYSGNIASALKKHGFKVVNVSGWSVAKINAYMIPADSVVGPGHVVTCTGPGKVLSFESNEFGGRLGGKKGDQTGREGRIRAMYARNRGWSYLIRPVVSKKASAKIRVATFNTLDTRFKTLTDERAKNLVATVTKANADIYLLTEASEAIRNVIRNGLGNSNRWLVWESHSSQAIVFDSLLWAHSDKEVVKFSSYHGGVYAVLTHRATGIKIAFGAYHCIPDSLTSESAQKEDMQGFAALVDNIGDLCIIGGDGMNDPNWISDWTDVRLAVDNENKSKPTYKTHITDRVASKNKTKRIAWYGYNVINSAGSDHNLVIAAGKIGGLNDSL